VESLFWGFSPINVLYFGVTLFLDLLIKLDFFSYPFNEEIEENAKKYHYVFGSGG